LLIFVFCCQLLCYQAAVNFFKPLLQRIATIENDLHVPVIIRNLNQRRIPENRKERFA
jgi:hypothetical protein